MHQAAQVGMGGLAEAVYRAMLGNPAWGVEQLAGHLDVAERQVRQALDELADLSLLERDPSGVLNVTQPGIGLSTLLAQAEADLQRRHRQIAAIAAIAASQERGGDRETTVRFHGVEAVRARIVELAASVRVECVSLNPRVAQTPDAKQASSPLNRQVLERGVAMRCVYQGSIANDPALVSYARWLTDLGGSIRTAATVPMLAIVYDREIAVLPIDPANSTLGAIEVRTPGLVGAVHALFEVIWAESTPFGEQAQLNSHGLDPQERDLLRLMAAGHTDQMAARRLGVSLRTVRRMASELMERLAARSRFQAGVEAARRGWL